MFSDIMFDVNVRYEMKNILMMHWKEYSKVDDTNSGTFMYLVNRISK